MFCPETLPGLQERKHGQQWPPFASTLNPDLSYMYKALLFRLIYLTLDTLNKVLFKIT